MRNLLDETLTMLTQFGKTPGDVFHVTDEHHSCSWGTFADEAQHINYSAGYGTVNINPDLRVVGIDWWLERNECTGSEWSEWSEWWEFKTMPVRHPDGRVALRRGD